MFKPTLFLSLILAVVAVPLQTRHNEAAVESTGYDTLFEPWTEYKARYLNLGCAGQETTHYYADCCYPLLSSQILALDRPYWCDPSKFKWEAPAPVDVEVEQVVESANVQVEAVEEAEAEVETTKEPQAVSECIIKEPVSEEPVVEEPVVEEPISEEPVVEEPVAEDPIVEEPVSEEPIAEEPVVEEPVTEEPVVEEPVTEEPVVEEPVTEEPVVEEPVVEEPITEEPVVEEPVTEEPVTEEPVVEEPVETPPSQANTGGLGTWFTQEGNPGACGDVHADTDMIAAISHQRYGPMDKRSDLCGKQVEITNTNTGAKVTVTITDVCPTCSSANSIDLSTGAFKAIAELSDGAIPISWTYL